MEQTDPIRETLIYRLVLVSGDSQSIMTEDSRSAKCLLRIRIPKWVRAAREIQKAIQLQWKLPSIIIDFLNDHPGSPICLAKLLSSHVPPGLLAMPVKQLDASELTDLEYRTVTAILADDAGQRGPFSRIGWIDEATEWIRESIAPEGLLAGQIEQHNASATFALVRFGLQGGRACWLKATGEPNRHEFSITSALAKICPKYLPPVIAQRDDWNAWLMRDAGEALDQSSRADRWKASVVTMADLQGQTCGHTDGLLSAGAGDHRTTILQHHIAELISYVDEAMERQTSAKVQRIGTR
ncbi:MAG: hypothetical protein WA426_19380, partial [Silvibacterium sp.]